MNNMIMDGPINARHCKMTVQFKAYNKTGDLHSIRTKVIVAPDPIGATLAAMARCDELNDNSDDLRYDWVNVGLTKF